MLAVVFKGVEGETAHYEPLSFHYIPQIGGAPAIAETVEVSPDAFVAVGCYDDDEDGVPYPIACFEKNRKYPGSESWLWDEDIAEDLWLW